MFHSAEFDLGSGMVEFTSSIRVSVIRLYLSFKEVTHMDLESATTVEIPSIEGGKRRVEVGKMYCIKYPLMDSDR